MKNKVVVLSHKQTDTYWSNDKDWLERWQSETISFGSVEMNTGNPFEVKTIMEKDGYVRVSKDDIPKPFRVISDFEKENLTDF
jgi:hypothetical protein